MHELYILCVSRNTHDDTNAMMCDYTNLMGVITGRIIILQTTEYIFYLYTT